MTGLTDAVCETCGKADCPDAAMPEFSEPRDCVYKPVYEALRRSKDCDYGCARDYTNQAVRLWVVEAVDQIVAARVREAREERDREWARDLTQYAAEREHYQGALLVQPGWTDGFHAGWEAAIGDLSAHLRSLVARMGGEDRG